MFHFRVAKPMELASSNQLIPSSIDFNCTFSINFIKKDIFKCSINERLTPSDLVYKYVWCPCRILQLQCMASFKG